MLLQLSDAPAEIPVIPGSARGFFTTTCKSVPQIAKLAPTKIAIIILGNLNSFIILILPFDEFVSKPLINSEYDISRLPVFHRS